VLFLVRRAFVAFLRGINENPPLDVPGSGVGYAIVDQSQMIVDGDEVRYPIEWMITVEDLTSTFTVAHFHGAAGIGMYFDKSKNDIHIYKNFQLY